MPDSASKFAITIERRYTDGVSDVLIDRLREAIALVLSQHEVSPEAAVTVVITDDEEVRALNKAYRNVDAATDVLSFPADPLPDEIQDEIRGEEGDYLGDLVMAVPYTRAHAEQLGHRFEDEMILLGVHGTLHLLGYDHDTDADQLEMWDTQHSILNILGITIRVPLFPIGDVPNGDDQVE